MYKNFQAIVLAAGKSSRFNSKQSKLIEKICGQEMILYITKLLKKIEIKTTLVIGHQKEIIETLITKHHGDKVNFAYQEEQKGTGHAVLCSQEFWNKDHILILNGDVPLITENIIDSLFKNHLQNNAVISFVIAHNIDPQMKSYGRVVQEGNSIKIIEAKDEKEERKEDFSINAGIYLINKEFLEIGINQLQKSSVTGELYITDLIEIANQQKQKIETLSVNFDLIRGINTLQELWAVEQIKRSELIKYWMDQGIRFSTAQNNHIDLNVVIGNGTCIGSGVQIYKDTKIGNNCSIEAFSIIKDSIIEDNVTIKSHTVIENSEIKNECTIGSFTHIHSDSTVNSNSTISNFVEIKKSDIGSQVKIKHLTYIGDSEIGNNVNIGAGTITCNFNGFKKEKSIIKDNVFIGSNNSLVAPVTIGKGAFTAAGSVITLDVPENALAIARTQQINKEDYVNIIRQKNKETEEAQAFIKANENKFPAHGELVDVSSVALVKAEPYEL